MANAYLQKYKGKKGQTFRLRWKIRIPGKDGVAKEKWVSKPLGTDSRFAKRERDKKRTEQDQGAGHADPTLTVCKFFEDYLRYCRNEKRPSTVKDFDQRIADLFGKQYGSWRMSDITPKHIETWKHEQLERVNKKGKKISSTRVKMDMVALRAAFSYAVKFHGLARNPAADVSLPKSNRPARIIFDAEIQSLIDALRVAAGDAVLFILNTGLRVGELAVLKPSLIDGDTLRIGPHDNFTTKTGNTRDIHLNAQALTILRRGKIFGLVRNTLESELYDVRTKLGLSRITWHMLRHNWASRRANEIKLPQLMFEGGWASLASVQIYQHPGIKTGVTYNVKLKGEA